MEKSRKGRNQGGNRKNNSSATGVTLAKDRAAIFEQKDKNHDGKLSREEFLANQRDPEAAKARFDKWDTNKDGFLSREEFINMGRKSK